MHFLVLLACLCKNNISKGINEGCWVIKFFFIVVLFICFCFVKNDFFQIYSSICKFVGAVYLLCLMTMLIYLFYQWSARWVELYESGQGMYAYLLVFFSVSLLGGCITLIVFNFIWFPGKGIALFINIFNVILVFVMSTLTLVRCNPKGSLLTIGAFNLYITYM